MLKRTPFYDFHVSAGGKLVDFAGWEMPLLYRGIVDEHEQTRKQRLDFRRLAHGPASFHRQGRDGVSSTSVLTRNVADQKVGQSRYSLVCNEAGGVLDDVIVSRDAKNWLMVCNASNREKLVKHFNDVRTSQRARLRHGRPDRIDGDGRDPGPEGDRPPGEHPAGRSEGDEAISLRDRQRSCW